MSAVLAGKKIIVVVGSMELGGAERQALYLAKYLSEHEHAVIEFWGIGAPGQLAQRCDAMGIPWKHYPLNFGTGFVGDCIQLVRLTRRIRAADPDVLLPYTWFPNVLCGLIWRFSGSRTCIWNQRDSGIALDATRIIHRFAARCTPFFIANSTHAADFLIDKFGVDKEHLAVIPNGVGLAPPRDDRTVWRLRLNVSDADFVGCMIANFTVLKDHGTAVRAWRLVVDQLTAGHRRAVLLLAGRDDGTANCIRTLILELGLEKNVCMLDSVDDVAGLLSSCDIGIHCAEHEGCPNAVMEEMASGLPVVASDNQGVRMVLGEGAEPFLAAYQDAEELAQRIILFAWDDSYRARVGQYNQQRISQYYRVETMCGNTARYIAYALEHTV